MTALSALDRIVRREARSIRGFEDEMAGELDLAAAQASCNPRLQLPLRQAVPYVGTRQGVVRLAGIAFSGWSGWRGAYSYAQLYGILNRVSVPGMTPGEQRPTMAIFNQNCMIYRYRFQGMDLRDAGYIGSTTGASSLRQRLTREIRIVGPTSSPMPGSQPPAGLAHIIDRLQMSAVRASFRLDIGSIVPPGVRNPSNVYYLEKLLQSRERPFGNPSGRRTFEDLEISGRFQ
jgi:hypothetical protein